jgi:hypothetical protein
LAATCNEYADWQSLELHEQLAGQQAILSRIAVTVTLLCSKRTGDLRRCLFHQAGWLN